MEGYPEILDRLPRALRKDMEGLDRVQYAQIEEIRLRLDCPVEIVIGGLAQEMPYTPDEAQMQELASALCGYARYRCEAQMAHGYISLPGGHRAGVCGRMTRDEDGNMHMAQITSVCIRITRHVAGSGRAIYPLLLDESGSSRSILLLGPPGCGKTTALRDCALYLSDRLGLHVAAADEREELFAQGMSGMRIDVMAGTPKAEALIMLIRTMAPQVVITDEVGGMDDAQAIGEAARCGVHVVATAHGRDMEDICARPALRCLLNMRAFDRYVILGRHAAVMGVYDRNGHALKCGEETDDDQYRCRGDGNDIQLRHRIPALGRRTAQSKMDSGDAALPAAYELADPL